MEKVKEYLINGSALGLLGSMGALAFQHPEMTKDFLMFGLAWILLRKGVRVELTKLGKTLTDEVDKVTSTFSGDIRKITNSIDELTRTMASLEKNHDARLTNLEIKVDRLTSQTIKE